jgi:hypothetical protein
MKRREVRYNEIYSDLSKDGIVSNKPTLTTHLKHLEKEHLIKRNVLDVQVVVYSIDQNIFKKVTGYIERVEKKHQELIKNKEDFTSLPFDEQFEAVLNLIAWIEVNKLRAMTLYITSSTFDNDMILRYWSQPSLKNYETWFMRQCKDNKEYLEKAINKLDDTIKQLFEEGMN